MSTPIPVKTIAVHVGPHLDEGAAIFLGRTFGEEKLPGITKAGFTFWDCQDTPDGRPVKEWIARGIVPIGRAKSFLDEHGRNGDSDCSTALMAKFLGISDLSELRALLRYASVTDNRAVQQPFSLPTVIKEVNLLYDQQQGEVVHWILPGVSAHLAGQRRFTADPQGYKDALKELPIFDLAVAEFLCRYHDQYGAEKVPGLDNTIRDFTASGQPLWDAVPWLRANVAAFSGKKKEWSAARLAARAFGLMENPDLSQLLQYVINPSDFRKSEESLSSVFEITRIAADMYLQHGNNANMALDWTAAVVAAKAYTGKLYTEARQEYAKAKVQTIRMPDGDARLVYLTSDNPKVLQVSHSIGAEKTGRYADVLILQRSSGHTCIFCNSRYAQYFEDVVRLVRLNEFRILGKPVPCWDVLTWDDVPGNSVWHFHKEGNNLYNGSLSAPNVPVTSQKFEAVVEQVRMGLDPRYFPEQSCKQGRCRSSLRSPCPLYEAGFKRCRQIRYLAKSRS